VVTGGYKRYRAEVRETLITHAPKLKLRVLAGLTGVGKTLLLKHLKSQGHQVIDLECLASHRGSALGKFPNETAQPSQRYFESLLVQDMFKINYNEQVWVEAESSCIGDIQIPKEFWFNMKTSPRVVISLPLQQRVKLILKEYGYWVDHPQELTEVLVLFRDKFGRTRILEWIHLIEQKRWIEFVECLLEYYDASYRFNKKKKQEMSNQGIAFHELFLENIYDKEQLARFIELVNSMAK